MFTRCLCPAMLAICLSLVGTACQSVPDTQEGLDALRERDVASAKVALDRIRKKDPSIDDAIAEAYGYAIFPSIASGALILGGEGGDGVVFREGVPWGHVKVAKGSIGLQIGGEAYVELVLLKTESAFDTFTEGKFAFAAGVSATAVESGAAINTKYQNDIAVLVLTKGGLMASAAAGGQQFTTKPYQLD